MNIISVKIDFSLLQIKNRQFDSSDLNLHVKNLPKAKMSLMPEQKKASIDWSSGCITLLPAPAGRGRVRDLIIGDHGSPSRTIRTREWKPSAVEWWPIPCCVFLSPTELSYKLDFDHEKMLSVNYSNENRRIIKHISWLREREREKERERELNFSRNQHEPRIILV